ncbi:MAG: hypothetical protein AAB519_01065 [Patescibacteria group bacterium]
MKNIFIISGPAGSGKDAVIEGLRTRFPSERVITSTTRLPREGETEGISYHFLSRENFEKALKENKFVEYSINENDELYGVTKEEIERVSKLPVTILWKMDWKGVVSVKKLFPEIPSLLITASLSDLEARLRRRDGKEKDETYFTERMNYTREWLTHTDIYDYIIENKEDALDETIAETERIIKTHFAEKK